MSGEEKKTAWNNGPCGFSVLYIFEIF